MKKVLKYGQKIISLKNKTSVLVGGCFDILHFGHFTFLKKAKERGDVLIVALESDEFIKRRKKKIPVHTQLQRAEILAAFGFVDYVILLPYLKSDEEYFKMVSLIKPNIIAVTAGDRHIKKKKEQAAVSGARVVVVSPYISKFASSKIAPYAAFFSD